MDNIKQNHSNKRIRTCWNKRKTLKKKKKRHISQNWPNRVLINGCGVGGRDCGWEELTTLQQVNNRPVLTRCEEAGGRSVACCWEVLEKSRGGGLINETWIPSGAETQTRCAQIIRQRWQSAGSHRSSQPGGLHSTLSIQPAHRAERRPGAGTGKALQQCSYFNKPMNC